MLAIDLGGIEMICEDCSGLRKNDNDDGNTVHGADTPPFIKERVETLSNASMIIEPNGPGRRCVLCCCYGS